MTWIQTFTGKAVDPLNLRPEDIDIRDIAHALSMQCRYAGHTKYFYSVAEHSVLMSQYFLDTYWNEGAGETSGEGLRLAKIALMHDATEAYLSDMVRPVKDRMPEYQAAEDRAWSLIAQKFDLPLVLPTEVKRADTMILNDERAALMGPPPKDWGIASEPLVVIISGWNPGIAERRFLSYASELGLI